MKYIIFVLLMVICILVVLCYALLVTVSEAEEKTERTLRRWLDENRDTIDSLKADAINAEHLKGADDE